MALVTKNFTLNVTPGAMPVTVHVSEYDIGRTYAVQLLGENGSSFEIPSGTTATIEGTLNGTVGFSTSATISNNQITFALTESMTAYAGKAWCKIKLTQNSQPIQTCAFILAVDRAGVEADTVIGADGFETQIQNAVNDYLQDFAIDDEVVRDAVDNYLDENGVNPESISPLVTEWLTDNVDPVGSAVVVDSSLSVQGAAADAKVTGDKINALNDASNELDDAVFGEKMTDASTILTNNNGAVTNNNDGTYTIGTTDYGVTIFGSQMTLDPGEYALYGVPNGFSFLSTSTALSDQFLRNDSNTPLWFEVNETAQCYLGFRMGSRPSASFVITPYLKKAGIEKITSDLQVDLDETGKNSVSYVEDILTDELGQLSAAVANVSNGTRNIPAEKDWTSGYVHQDGTVEASAAFAYSQKIPVVTGDVVQVRTGNDNASVFRALTAYDLSNALPDKGVDTESASYTVPDGVYFVRVTISSADLTYFVKITRDSKVYSIKVPEEIITGLANGFSPFRFRPCIDHLFVSDAATSMTIPHESVYHVRVSKSLGFDAMEANVAETGTSGKYIVNHLEGGKFGKYFHHVDGVTDISNIAVASVTWDWIVANVRYNSRIEKYRTRPCLLEEFLAECRQQNIIPLVTASDPNVIRIVERYMGKGNYIAYNATRANCPDAIITHWVGETTKERILAYCRSIGKPFVYGMSNPTAFADNELQEIVDAVHAEGYWIGTSYQDTLWYKYSSMGFDSLTTQDCVNRIETGNLYNFRSIYGFDDFAYANASEMNGVLTFTSDGAFLPDIPSTTYPLCMFDVELWFSGEITLQAIGSVSARTYTSDGSKPVFVARKCVNESPKCNFTVKSGTVIYDATYKASAC